jgi:hypothetical protein
METRGRQLFHDYIDIIRKSKNSELNQKSYCAQYFMRKIDDTYHALNVKELMKLYDENIEIRFIHDIILNSMIYSLIFFMYGLFEIIDDDFNNNPVKKLRNKIGHGKKYGKQYAPINSFTQLPDEIFLNHEFNDLMGCLFTRGDLNTNIISLVWHFRKNDGTMISKVDNIEYESSVYAREYLLKKLNTETLFIDSTGNFACNIDNLYHLACDKVEKYLNNNFGEKQIDSHLNLL